MDSSFVAQATRLYKERYGLEVHNPEEMLQAQRHLLEFVMAVGREIEQQQFAEIGKGYEGPGIEKQHTPAMQHFLASFTGRDPYGESPGRFHEIFRPEGAGVGIDPEGAGHGLPAGRAAGG